MTGTKYQPLTIAEVIRLLEDGNTDKNVCALVGITTVTLYDWMRTKPEFAAAVESARAIAMQRAVDALKSGMQSQQEVRQTVTEFSETRIGPDGKPYEYKKTVKEQTLVKMPVDPKWAIEYLKRRDPSEWGESAIIRVTPEEAEIMRRFGWTPTQAWQNLVSNISKINPVNATPVNAPANNKTLQIGAGATVDMRETTPSRDKVAQGTTRRES